MVSEVLEFHFFLNYHHRNVRMATLCAVEKKLSNLVTVSTLQSVSLFYV